MKQDFAMKTEPLLTHHSMLGGYAQTHTILKPALLGLLLMFLGLSAGHAVVSVSQDWAMPLLMPLHHDFTNGMVVKPDLYGNTYVVGELGGVAPTWDHDLYLAKYDCQGATVTGWAITYDQGSGKDDFLCDVAVDAAGNLFVATVNNVPGVIYPNVLKFSPSGTLLNHVVGPQPMGYNSQLRIAVAKDGDILVGGGVSIAGQNVLWAARYDNLLNSKGCAYSSPAALHWHDARGMAVDDSGNIYLLGNDVSQPPYSSDWFVQRFDGGTSAGPKSTPIAGVSGFALAWDRFASRVFVATFTGGTTVYALDDTLLQPDNAWGGAGSVNDPNFYAVAIATDADGDAVLAGTDSSNNKLRVDRFISLDGSLATGYPVVGTTLANASAVAMTLDEAGNVYVTGTTWWPFYDILTIRVPKAGTATDWETTYDYSGYNENRPGIAVNKAGNLLLAAQSDDMFLNNHYLSVVSYSQGPPVNDHCSMATTLTGPGTVAFSTAFATDSNIGSGNSCGVPLDVKDVWFQWTAPCSGMVEVDTYHACFDTTLAVYDTIGCPGQSDLPIACNDDATAGQPANSPQSQVTFSANSGQTYYIQVGESVNASPSNTRQGRLTLMGPTPVAPTCPAPGTCNPIVRDFEITGPYGGTPWPWSISVPCCLNIEGTAGTSGGTGAADIVAGAVQAITAACPGGAVTASAVGTAVLRITVYPCSSSPCPDTFVFRVGSPNTPSSDLVVVPDVQPQGLLTAGPLTGSSGYLQFNPTIVQVSTNLAATPTSLSITRASTDVILSWANPAYRLQATPRLGPAANWGDVTGSSPVTVPIGADNQFFRLVTP
jgi:hypothetical protein